MNASHARVGVRRVEVFLELLEVTSPLLFAMASRTTKQNPGSLVHASCMPREPIPYTSIVTSPTSEMRTAARYVKFARYGASVMLVQLIVSAILPEIILR